MLASEIRKRVNSPEFKEFTLVMAKGERIPVRHRDSIGIISSEVRGQRIFSPWITVLETRDDSVVEHSTSLSLIAKIEDIHPLNGTHEPRKAG